MCFGHIPRFLTENNVPITTICEYIIRCVRGDLCIIEVPWGLTDKYPRGGFPTDTDELKSRAHFRNEVLGV